jgi:hypothetical protein
MFTRYTACFLMCALALPMAEAYQYPDGSIAFLKEVPKEIYLGQTIHIPMRLYYQHMKGHQYWIFKPGTSGEKLSLNCAAPFSGETDIAFGNGFCDFDLVLHPETIGSLLNAQITYHTFRSGNLGKHKFRINLSSESYPVRVVPHPFSFGSISTQKAVANQSFSFKIKPYALYFDENAKNTVKPDITVSPLSQAGLTFNKETLSIEGKPTKTGIVHFSVNAKLGDKVIAPVDLTIQVEVNSKDKPVFKAIQPELSIIPNKTFQLNLMNLLEPTQKQTVWSDENQITFRIDNANSTAKNFHIRNDDGVVLEGVVGANDIGKPAEISIIATSNTGGDSLPYVLTMPINTDPDLKPHITSEINLEAKAGQLFYQDLSAYILDKTNDDSVAVYIDSLYPKLGWLTRDNNSLTALIGEVPLYLKGDTLTFEIHAENRMGGASSHALVNLHVN